MKELEALIVTILGGDSTLQTLLGGTGTDKRIYPSINGYFENFPSVTYEIAQSIENTVPASTQLTDLVIKSYSKDSKTAVEDISSRVKTLLKYYNTQTPRIFWMKKTNEFDNNQTDRLLYSKILRYSVWSNIP